MDKKGYFFKHAGRKVHIVGIGGMTGERSGVEEQTASELTFLLFGVLAKQRPPVQRYV